VVFTDLVPALRLEFQTFHLTILQLEDRIINSLSSNFELWSDIVCYPTLPLVNVSPDTVRSLPSGNQRRSRPNASVLSRRAWVTHPIKRPTTDRARRWCFLAAVSCCVWLRRSLCRLDGSLGRLIGLRRVRWRRRVKFHSDLLPDVVIVVWRPIRGSDTAAEQTTASCRHRDNDESSLSR